MKVFSIILGILLVVCGISLASTPLLTFFETGYFLVILLMVNGIFGIIRAITAKRFGTDFVISILGLVLGAIIAFVPGLKLMTSGTVLYIMAFWFLIAGIFSIVHAFQMRKTAQGKQWIFNLVLGILNTLIAIYSILHPLILAFALGILISVYFIMSGINMLAASFQKNSAQ